MTEDQNIAMHMKFEIIELLYNRRNPILDNAGGQTHMLSTAVPVDEILKEAKKLYKWVSQDDRKAPKEVEA